MNKCFSPHSQCLCGYSINRRWFTWNYSCISI